MIPKTNYVLATWIGARRSDPRIGTHYLDLHLDSLTRKHSLSQITVVVPFAPSLTSVLRQKIQSRKRIRDIPIEYLFRENIGMSYGGWSDAYLQYRTDFDYYFFIEDDYVYVKDDFDSIMIETYQSEQCGYLCTLARMGRHNFVHAAISNGLASSSVLEKIVGLYGRLPYDCNDSFANYNHYDGDSQIGFSKAFVDNGFKIADTTHRFRAPYWHPTDRAVVEFAPNRTEYLIQPIQLAIPSFQEGNYAVRT